MLELRDSRSCESREVRSGSVLFGTSGRTRRRYPEDFVQRQLAELRAHGGLSQLGDGVFWILHAVARLAKEGVSDQKVSTR